ncbi:MAG: ATP-binding protein [Aquificaceae bacterium]|nr:ATP-binding protein [Aquificaceae bacterium]
MSLLKDFLGKVGEGYLLLDSEGRVLLANDFLLKRGLISQVSEEIAYYQCLKNLTAISCVAEALSEKRESYCQFSHEECEYALFAFPGGELCIVRITDVTEFKRYERSKRHFVANVSHELKTPLAVLQSILETLYDEEENPQKRNFLEKALRRVDELNRLVRDLLILTKLESGEERLRPERIGLCSLVEEVFELFESQASSMQVSMENKVPEGFSVFADPEKLFLLLKNLVDNGIKYNKVGGKLTISAYEDGRFSIISVEDSGIGIPKEHIPFVFERFYRVDDSRSRDLGGTGLGLSIVKHIALSHGGKVDLSSKEGEGSVFRVYLPLGG